MRMAPTEANWPEIGRPMATAALEVCEGLEAAEEAEAAALDAEERIELIAELTGAVAVLMALDIEDSTLALTELALATAEDADASEAIEDVTEAGIVVATPPMVVVMRSLTEASEAVEAAEVTEASEVAEADEIDADVAVPPTEDGQAVFVPASEQICW